eukprot:TRINITY_DN3340_c0_g1_i1.p1 TRINITY_DN3340_c0_g1~~TRINITY_DN3340_c0_g1_i1.p1  ORF type:complete len:323 (+),score=67.27 TRINITY_DN3340_c0_g1_i1:96-971(+)
MNNIHEPVITLHDDNFDYKHESCEFLNQDWFLDYLGVQTLRDQKPSFFRANGTFQKLPNSIDSRMELSEDELLLSIRTFFDISVRHNKKDSSNKQDCLMSARDEGCFELKCEPSDTVDVMSYLDRLQKYCKLNSMEYYYTMVYVQRLIHAVDYTLNEFNTHKLLLSCLVCALKFLRDKPKSNKHYAKVGGIPLKYMNKLERLTLGYLEFNLYVTEDELADVMEQMAVYYGIGALDLDTMEEYGISGIDYITMSYQKNQKKGRNSPLSPVGSVGSSMSEDEMDDGMMIESAH